MPYRDLEPAVAHIGRELQAHVRQRRSRRDRAEQRLLDVVVAEPAARARLFQLVDAFPALRGSEDVSDHIIGYLDDEGVPAPLRLAVRASRRVPGGDRVSAGVARRGITHMASRFIAGTDAAAARPTFERIWAAGMGVIVDLLGEKTITQPDADRYAARVESSWAGAELRSMRNFHQAFQQSGLFGGMLRSGIQMYTGGLDILGDHLGGQAGYQRMRKLADRHPAGKPAPVKGDGGLTFDKLADVFLSGTTHDEDQPVHLRVRDTSICATKCREEFGNPCQHFCPAAVYEMVPDPAKPDALKLHINASNCVHCKTCDIADPYQIITWVPPEGGGGPQYEGM
jgi:ferredoxin-like protein FixX